MTVDLNYQMLRIRRVEEAIAAEYPRQQIRTPVHLSIGQEAVACGVCSNLRKTDKVYSGHRAHAHYLAKGGNLDAFIAELYGKATGCAGGRGGSMHLQDTEQGFMGSSAIVGATVPLAVGSAWADKLLGRDNVTVVFFGDGCMEEGVMSEAFNFAALHRLPIVFICENNGLAVTTPLKDRQPDRQLYKIPKAYGLTSNFADGQNVGSVRSISYAAIENARSGYPQFIEFITERQRVHCGTEHEFVLSDDPLKYFTPTDEQEQAIAKEIAEAFEFAKQSPKPTNPERGVYA